MSSADYRTFSSYYFEEAFRNTDVLIERATRKLQDVPFDTLVGTGVSGTIFVPILARALDKHLDDRSQGKVRAREIDAGR